MPSRLTDSLPSPPRNERESSLDKRGREGEGGLIGGREIAEKKEQAFLSPLLGLGRVENKSGYFYKEGGGKKGVFLVTLVLFLSGKLASREISPQDCWS